MKTQCVLFLFKSSTPVFPFCHCSGLRRFSSVTSRIFSKSRRGRFTADVSFFFTGISEKGDVKSPETSLHCELTAETHRPLQQVKPTHTWTWMHLGETWPAVCVCVYRLRRRSWTLVTQWPCVEKCRNCTVHSASCELLSLFSSLNHFKLHDNGSFFKGCLMCNSLFLFVSWMVRNIYWSSWGWSAFLAVFQIKNLYISPVSQQVLPLPKCLLHSIIIKRAFTWVITEWFLNIWAQQQLLTMCNYF